MFTLTKELTKQYKESFQSKPERIVAQNAAVKNGLKGASETVASVVENQPVYSIDLEHGKVANQKASGRCWMFAALNTFRHRLFNNFKLEEFELSQSYTFFWDKYEKANYFHENILKTAGEPVTSRNVAFLLQTPQQDGGQWDMIVSIFKKYGVVPKSVMPESFSSSASSDLNKYLNKKLRQDAKVLRDLVARGASEAEINETRKQLMREVYDLLSVTLGTPPETFDFEYRDKDKEFHRHLNLTPQSFFEQFVGLNLDDYVSIINSPTADKPFNRSYTVEMLGNVVGNQVRYLNLDMATFKELAIRQLEQGESVWFGCDVGQSSNRGNGRLALNNFDLKGLTGIDYSLTKGERLEYGDSLMTHAMVLTGVNLVDGKPNRWKVENSWGEESGVEGFWMMSDEWMDEYTYQIVIRKDLLTKEQLDAFNSEPIVLAPWDPMGSLA
ncbi:aminopeptidase [Granulicatella sp. HMSC30F09]|uniref:aminopeptidase C n=1 Tax=Granulicatella sp. HMSC30F09 TaxID=1581071 RepID=UPI0008A37D01|nr:C1 family peptidase [Granulicatella sp. HMSC30F09]OFT80401.1 aminopeptidase [Granulicatella sp. HMSC30F09]